MESKVGEEYSRIVLYHDGSGTMSMKRTKVVYTGIFDHVYLFLDTETLNRPIAKRFVCLKTNFRVRIGTEGTYVIYELIPKDLEDGNKY